MEKYAEIRECFGNDYITRDTEEYIVIERYPAIDYALLYRNTSFLPWVAAWGYDDRREGWAQGHYFGSLTQATEYLEGVYARYVTEEDFLAAWTDAYRGGKKAAKEAWKRWLPHSKYNLIQGWKKNAANAFYTD